MSSKNSVVDIGVFRVADERLSCAPFSLGFGTTAEVEPLEEHVFIGQSRAEESFEKGFATPGHIFVVGLDSISTALLRNIGKKAAASMSGPRVSDIVCVHNFNNPEKPRFIELGKGKAMQLEKAVEKLSEELKEKIPERLESDDFGKSIKEVRDRVDSENNDEWSNLAKETESNTFDVEGLGKIGFSYNISPTGIAIFPIVLLDQKRPVTNKEYSVFKESEHEECSRIRSLLMARVSATARKTQKREQELEEEVAGLRREFIDALFREKTEKILTADYGEDVFNFIDGLREYTLERINSFVSKDSNGPSPIPFQAHSDPFLPFKINVFVDNSKTEGVPVIEHRNADYERIFGEVKYAWGPGGAPVGGHTMVRAGLISEANHGVLVLLAEDVFGRPGVWERLKAVLETKRLDIGRGIPSWFSNGNTSPETLHVDIKLVLVDDRHIYDILNSPGIKQKFDEIFKTVAEFDPVVSRSEEVVQQVAGLIRLFCDRESLPAVSADGVKEFIKYLSRATGDQNKVSLDARSLKDLLNEAAWLAREEAKAENKSEQLITVDNVKQAINNKAHRLSLIRDKMYEFIENGDVLLTLSGSEVGQINGLSVYDLGYLAFGVPSRITAKTFAGTKGVINIEREAGLSGRTHNKGVLILGGYIGAKYGYEMPLSFSATLSFEQSHGGVDGDSASSTELYAILSSLSGLPLRQDIAVTGAVGQNGDIQPIGGVNQKTEGFFDICSAFTLTGSQGVMIPHQNVKNLVLREDVVSAVEEGKFHIFAIKTIEEGMEILTGKKMGAKIKKGERKGQYQKGTINWLVSKRLAELQKASEARK